MEGPGFDRSGRAGSGRRELLTLTDGNGGTGRRHCDDLRSHLRFGQSADDRKNRPDNEEPRLPVIPPLSLTLHLEQPQEPELGVDSRIPYQGDRAGTGAGAAAAAPAPEGRQRVRPRGEGHNGAAIVRGRTRGAAVDAGGAGGDCAAAQTLEDDREGEATDAEAGGDGGVGGEREGAGTGARTAATSPAVKSSVRGGRRCQSDRGPAIVGGGACGAAIDAGRAGGHGAAARALTSHREREPGNARRDAEASEHGGVGGERDGARAGTRTATTRPPLKGGAVSRGGGEGDDGAVVVGGRTRRPAADPGGTRSDGAAACALTDH